MPTLVLIQLSSPFLRSARDLPAVRQAVAVLAYARPVPTVVCFFAAGLFLFQALRHRRKALQERLRVGGSSRRAMWFQVSTALGVLLALAWIALLALELRYPDTQSPAQEIRP